MAYKKILVDNLSCSRRFNIAYDDNDSTQNQVSVSCQHCGAKIFTAKEHPPVTLIRDEIVINKNDLSDYPDTPGD